MERVETHNQSEHVIDITSSSEASPSRSTDGPVNQSNLRQNEDLPSTSVTNSTANVGNSRNTLFARRENVYGQTSALNSGYWVFTELVITVSQIIAAIVVLSLSRHEHSQAPLFTWIIGYACGCAATLPLLFWRFHNRNQPSSAQESSQPHQTTILMSARVKVAIEYFKMGLDCFFAVWFVVGNVWIFGDHSASSDAPNLYRLCLVFLTFTCLGYAMPFILCATICCCLPCIISIMGFQEDPTNTRGADTESINSLPTYKFKIRKNNKHTNDKENNLGAGEGGVVAAGTEKEHVISGEDAVCCICLAKYANNDELRELPCSHFFHKNCVDKWLKINASCPLCKIEVGGSISSSQTEATASNALR